MHRIFETQIEVLPDHLDRNGHVNNVVFVQWMQDLAVQHAVANGCDDRLLTRLGCSWVARSHHIDYIRSAEEGDVIGMSTWLFQRRKVSCRRRYQFKNHSSGELLVQAETEWVFVNANTGRPLRIPEEVMNLFEIVDSAPENKIF